MLPFKEIEKRFHLSPITYHLRTMPIDELALPKDLTAQEEQLTRVELQNRRGLKNEMISDLTQGKYLTILAVETEDALTQQEYFTLLAALKTNHGVLAMQTAFAAPIPVEPDYRCDLHLTAHLRLEKQEAVPETEELL